MYMTLEDIMKTLEHPEVEQEDTSIDEAVEEMILEKHDIVRNEIIKRYNIEDCKTMTSHFRGDKYEMEFYLKDSTKICITIPRVEFDKIYSSNR